MFSKYTHSPLESACWDGILDAKKGYLSFVDARPPGIFFPHSQRGGSNAGMPNAQPPANDTHERDAFLLIHIAYLLLSIQYRLFNENG